MARAAGENPPVIGYMGWPGLQIETHMQTAGSQISVAAGERVALQEHTLLGNVTTPDRFVETSKNYSIRRLGVTVFKELYHHAMTRTRD